MKNRNIPYYMAVLALAAGMSTSFVSCVDTDEPDSIIELRKAKANEVNAKAQKELAEAAVQNAAADLAKAKQAALVAAEELKNKAAELEVLTAQLEYDKAKATSENEIAAAKLASDQALVEAQNALDKAKIDAEVALIEYQNKVATAKKTAAVELAHLNANGVNDELKNALQQYNNDLDAVAEALQTLKDDIADLSDGAESDLQAKVDEAKEALDASKQAKADFEADATRLTATEWQAKYDELKKKIEAVEPTTNKLQYEITDLGQQLETKFKAAVKPLEDYADSVMIYEGNVAFAIDDKLQKLDIVTNYEDEFFNYDEDEKGLVAKKDIKVEDFEDAVEAGLNTLISIANVLQNDIDKYNSTKLEDAHKTTIENVRKAETGLYAKWQDAVRANDGTSGKESALRTAAKALFGSDGLEGDGAEHAPWVTEPTIENLTAYYLKIYDEETAKEKAEDKYYNGLGAFSECVLAEKEIADAKANENAYASAKTLINAINAKVEAIEARGEKLYADYEKAAEAEDVVKMVKDLESKTDELNKLTDEKTNNEALAGIIEGWTITLTDAEGDDMTVGTDEFNAAYATAIAAFDKKIASDQKKFDKATAKLEAFKTALATGEKGDFSASDKSITGIQTIVDDQKALEDAQKTADKSKAEYDLLVEAYK